MLGQLGTHLGGVAVDGLLAAENGVELALQLLHLLHGVVQNVAGGQGVGAAEGPAGHQVRLVGGNGQALLQSGGGLRGSHGQHHDLGVGVLVLDPGGSLQGIAVEGVDNAGNAVTDEGVLHRVDLDLCGVRHLLDTDENVHLGFLQSEIIARCFVRYIVYHICVGLSAKT